MLLWLIRVAWMCWRRCWRTQRAQLAEGLEQRPLLSRVEVLEESSQVLVWLISQIVLGLGLEILGTSVWRNQELARTCPASPWMMLAFQSWKSPVLPKAQRKALAPLLLWAGLERFAVDAWQLVLEFEHLSLIFGLWFLASTSSPFSFSLRYQLKCWGFQSVHWNPRCLCYEYQAAELLYLSLVIF